MFVPCCTPLSYNSLGFGSSIEKELHTGDHVDLFGSTVKPALQVLPSVIDMEETTSNKDKKDRPLFAELLGRKVLPPECLDVDGYESSKSISHLGLEIVAAFQSDGLLKRDVLGYVLLIVSD